MVNFPGRKNQKGFIVEGSVFSSSDTAPGDNRTGARFLFRRRGGTRVWEVLPVEKGGGFRKWVEASEKTERKKIDSSSGDEEGELGQTPGLCRRATNLREGGPRKRSLLSRNKKKWSRKGSRGKCKTKILSCERSGCSKRERNTKRAESPHSQ